MAFVSHALAAPVENVAEDGKERGEVLGDDEALDKGQSQQVGGGGLWR